MRELQQQAFAIAARILARREDAEDVAQEAILRLLKARLNGTPIVAQQAFARRVALRLAIDRLRAEHRRANRAPRLIAETASVPEAAALPAEVARLYEAIAQLPARQAAVVTLRKLMELEYPDIADLLGISVENCRSHCRLALQRLREMLIEPGEDCERGSNP